jgi:LCP family protein required for cell wall assembly
MHKNPNGAKTIDGFKPYINKPRPQKTVQPPPIQRPMPETSKSIVDSPLNKYRGSLSNQPSLLNSALPIPRYSQSDYQSSAKTKKHKKWSTRRKILTPILTTLIIFLAIGIWLGSSIVGNLDKVFHGNIFSDASSIFNNTTLRGQNQGRINILLAGDSVDQIGHGGAALADTIIVFSINTHKHTAFMLSIPRDLWVYIPGFPGSGYQKINAANDGMGTNFPGYPQNGMGQLEHILKTDLGIPIDYYSVSDYGALRDVVNAVGGITVNIQSPDPRGLYDPYTNLKLPNGIAYLNGQEALNLARARGDGPGSYGFPSSDFDRTAHQRLIISAIAAKAKTLGFLSNPIKISNLFNAIGDNVQTDLNLSDILALVKISKGINLNNIKSYAFCSTLNSTNCGTPILTDYTNPGSGEEALIPVAGINNYTALQAYYQQLIKNN